MKERLHYVDVCKGILILMVIWQHIMVYSLKQGIDSEWVNKIGGGITL